MTFYHGTREVTVELYRKYLVNENELDQLWQANAGAMLDYLEHAQQGVRGIVTDNNGLAVGAEVEVLEHQACDAARCAANATTDLPVGDYHRMLLSGTYRLRFSAQGYTPVERTVVVNDGTATRLDVVMRKTH